MQRFRLSIPFLSLGLLICLAVCSLTRLCLEGFLLNVLLVSGCGPLARVPPAAGGGLPPALQPGSLSLVQPSSAAQLSQAKPS